MLSAGAGDRNRRTTHERNATVAEDRSEPANMSADPPAGGVRLADLRGIALAVAAVLAVLAVAYDIPLAATLAAGGAILGAAALVLRSPRDRRIGATRAPRRALVWPDEGMRVVAESLTDPCIIVDGSGVVRHVNREATARFGLVQPGDPLSFRLRVTVLHDAIERVIGGGPAETVEWSERIPTESRLVAHLSPIRLPPKGEGQRPDFVLLVIEDLTERHRLERMRVDFVANASHELRTPLASLAGFIETLQGPAKNDSEARERFLTIMGEQAQRMKRLIDDLLSLSRIEMKAHLRPDAPVDLAEIVAHVTDALTPLARDHGVTIAFDRPAGGMPARGDRDELVQVFSNLVENAIKYGASGRSVEIETRREEGGGPMPDGWVVAVRDHGPGIAPEHLPRLTERFYRADIVSSREKQGTGLGLAIVKHIVARHRGRLTIQSEPGRGSVFAVRLDAREADAA